MAIHRFNVTVPRIDIPFAEAVRRAGPDTKPDIQWATEDEENLPMDKLVEKMIAESREILCRPLIWQAESLYRDIHNPTSGEVTLTLINLGRGSKTAGPTAALLAKTEGLIPASPFEVFAVGIQRPTLYRELKMEPSGILSPIPRMLDGVNRICCVWQGSVQKECAFVPFDYPLHDGYWFAFAEPQ